MIINRGAKLQFLLIIMVISIFFTSSIAMGAPHYLPGEIDEKAPSPQEEQVLDDETGQEPENIEDDILSLDGDENTIQSETLPLEPIIIPPEPFMGAPVDVPADTKPPLPQTGARLLYMEAGSLLTIIGMIINGKSR